MASPLTWCTKILGMQNFKFWLFSKIALQAWHGLQSLNKLFCEATSGKVPVIKVVCLGRYWKANFCFRALRGTWLGSWGQGCTGSGGPKMNFLKPLSIFQNLILRNFSYLQLFDICNGRPSKSQFLFFASWTCYLRSCQHSKFTKSESSLLNPRFKAPWKKVTKMYSVGVEKRKLRPVGPP